MPKSNRQKQRDYIATQKAKGLKRLVLWVRPENVETHRIAAEQPQALNRIRRRVETEVERETRARVSARLDRRTERALLAQRRARARRQQASSNRPPEMIRFKVRPPGAVRNRLKAAGWFYDPVDVVWHLPENPEAWPATERLLDELEPYDIERLVKPLDDEASG